MPMSARMSELALKKRMLRQRSAVLRHAFALQVNARLAPVAGMADRAVSTGRWLGRHPYWAVAAVVALAVWRPKGIARLAGRGLWLWQMWSRLQPVLTPLLSQLGNPVQAGQASTAEDRDSTNA